MPKSTKKTKNQPKVQEESNSSSEENDEVSLSEQDSEESDAIIESPEVCA